MNLLLPCVVPSVVISFVELVSCLVTEEVPSEDSLDASVGAKVGLILVLNLLSVGVIFSS